MSGKNTSKFGRVRAIIASFLVLIGLMTGVGTTILNANDTYAVPDEGETTSETTTENNSGAENAEPNSNSNNNSVTVNGAANSNNVNDQGSKTTGNSCKDSLGALGWVVCPSTGKISEAVDWLYDKIEQFLVVSPISTEDGSPIYEIWKYCRGLTNIVFIIFLLVVIYSQLTGFGISNYGLKKVLPKLIVTAVLVNLSFLICSLAVDVSNIVGNSLRGVFTSVEETTLATSTSGMGPVSLSSIFNALVTGGTLAIGAGAIAFEFGMIWMLIPIALGAIVAVVTGLITIALRQAVVALLIMISPLAMVAYMLPNTEQWFKKWKDLLTRMLVFYPMFSLLFGASSLAGFAIIMSAKDGFGLLLGLAVQIFPLFFAWKLMQMSGTFLGGINAKLRGLADKPLAANREWANSHRMLSRSRQLDKKAYTPSLKLIQFMNDRKVGREAEIETRAGRIKDRGLAAYTFSHYNKDGSFSKRGQKEYEAQKRDLRYKQAIEMGKNNFNRGLSGYDKDYKDTIARMKRDFRYSTGIYDTAIRGVTKEDKLENLDKDMVKAADDYKTELVRGAEIEYQNAKGFFDRVLNAKFAEGDYRALVEGNRKHQMHGVLDDPENIARYNRMKAIMEGNDDSVQTVLADAASTLSAQAQVRRNKFQSAGELTPATQNVADHIKDLIENPEVAKNIDAVIGGLRVLNMRGDTDIVAKQLEHDLVGILSNSGNIELGTYASQAIANYGMFEVKDNDPVLRRFGKYINMQTAALYNDNDPGKRRKRKDVSWWEYVNSEYVEHDDNGKVAYDDKGQVVIKKTRGMRELMMGTTYSRVERTAYKSQREGVRAASYDIDANGNLSSQFNVERYLNNMDALYKSTLANIIGDQFSYLSGSEQIIALARDITGVKDGKWDWKYIFGDELENPTLEQKAEYIMRSRNLVKTFLGGHVPSQIARSKTDMLQAIEAQYALFAEVMRVEDDGKEVVDLEKLKALEERVFTNGGEDDKKSYKHFLKEKQDQIKERFQKSFSEDAVKGFAKQFRKGYQGEAKDSLIRLLDPEALYEKYYPNGDGDRRSRRRGQYDEDDDEDGMPVGSDLDGQGLNGGIYNDTRERVQEIFDRYRGPEGRNVEDCWAEVNSVLESSIEMGDLRIVLDEFAEGVSQYTDVSQLYADIMRTFFGSD